MYDDKNEWNCSDGNTDQRQLFNTMGVVLPKQAFGIPITARVCRELISALMA